ncbi:potassium ABC transporter ATPase [Undibacterium squillarum]|nr:potassium ABC transporter ATPase [Undibacterium squillarum]
MDLIYIGYTLLFAAISCALIAGCHRLRGDK